MLACERLALVVSQIGKAQGEVRKCNPAAASADVIEQSAQRSPDACEKWQRQEVQQPEERDRAVAQRTAQHGVTAGCGWW